MKRLSLIILSAFVASVVARADMISIFNTGVDNSNALLALGSTDPHYLLLSSPLGAGTPFAGTNIPATYIANGPNSQWISPTSNAGASEPAGVYTYTTTFSLPANFISASLSGQWATDNEGALSLNGGLPIATTPMMGFTAFSPFTITSGFVAGLNTLTFAVTNDPSDTSNPTALRVEINGSFSTTVPDTGSSVALLGGALLALGIFRRMFQSVLAPSSINRRNVS
jgi:protein with PEP-CTERM/exosortase system signal